MPRTENIDDSEKSRKVADFVALIKQIPVELMVEYKLSKLAEKAYSMQRMPKKDNVKTILGQLIAMLNNTIAFHESGNAAEPPVRTPA